MPSIYIVEDDTDILAIESYALKGAGFEAQGFESAAGFNAVMKAKLPDLILLDIMLPDEDGIHILQRLRRDVRTAAVPIIMVTAKSTEIDVVRGLEDGADDYISKPFGIMELLSRVKAVLRRARPQQVLEELELGGIRLVPDKRLCEVGGSTVALTFKEFELLECLLRNAGIVMKRDVLLDQIWGIDFEGETRTLDAHIKTLRQKLGEAGRHITTVRNVGYLME